MICNLVCGSDAAGLWRGAAGIVAANNALGPLENLRQGYRSPYGSPRGAPSIPVAPLTTRDVRADAFVEGGGTVPGTLPGFTNWTTLSGFSISISAVRAE
jgi:hypothetical protein